MTDSDSLFDFGVGFRGQAIQCRHSQNRGSNKRRHGNRFWDYISYKGPWWEITTWQFLIMDGYYLVIPKSIGRLLWFCSCQGQNCSMQVTVPLGIDTSIANILVVIVSVLIFATSNVEALFYSVCFTHYILCQYYIEMQVCN